MNSLPDYDSSSLLDTPRLMAVRQQNLPMQEYTLSFGTFQFYSDYVTSSINEGVDLDEKKFLQFYALCHEVFQGRRFSVIELRDHPFSIDPLFYMRPGDTLKNVKSHSMVVDPNSRMKLRVYESNLIKHCPFGTFYSLNDAVSWAKSI